MKNKTQDVRIMRGQNISKRELYTRELVTKHGLKYSKLRVANREIAHFPQNMCITSCYDERGWG